MPTKPPRTKQVRVRLQHYDLIAELRRKMSQMTLADNLALNPEANLTDGMILDVALLIANAAVNPRLVLIDREKFGAALEREINEKIKLFTQLDPDQRSALLDMLIATHAVISPYKLDSPLRAAVTPTKTKQ